MDDTTQPTSLVDLLGRDYVLYEDLHALLLKEKKALIEHQVDALNAIQDEKQALLSNIESHDAVRKEFLINSGMGENIQDFIAQVKGSEKNRLEKAWQQLRDILFQCQRQNQVNGNAIAVSVYNGNRLQQILRGFTGEGDLYDDKGNIKSSQISGSHEAV